MKKSSTTMNAPARSTGSAFHWVSMAGTLRRRVRLLNYLRGHRRALSAGRVAHNDWMERSAAAAGSSLFFALAPGVVAGVIPWAITGWEVQPAWWGWRVLGALVTAAGAAVLIHAVWRFVVEGVGTPAPVAPTQHLVGGGRLRVVPHPMYRAGVPR